MNNLNAKIGKFVREWSNHAWSSGPTTGEDYESFQRKYRNLLKGVAEEAGFELYHFGKNHYCFSAVLRHKETGAFAFVSISDVRFFNGEWHSRILYRQMRHEKDWAGLNNHFSTLEELPRNLFLLFPNF